MKYIILFIGIEKAKFMFFMLFFTYSTSVRDKK